MAMRNYRAMNPDKLGRCLSELVNCNGDAYDRVVQRGEDLEAHLNTARSAAKAAGISVEETADEPATERPAKLPSAVPLYVRPMLAFDVNGDLGVVPRDGSWVMEPKWDGWRWQVHRLADGVRTIGGRNGKDHSGEIPEVDAELMELLPPNTILDGEIVWENNLVGARAAKQVMFVAFDVLQDAGVNVMRESWTERRDRLDALLRTFERLDGEQVIQASEHVYASHVADVDDGVFERWIELGMEGAVCKRRACSYIPGSRRQDGWVKVKPQATTDATVTGFVMGKGDSNLERCGALEIVLHETGAMTTVIWDATPAEAEQLVGRILEVQHYGFNPSGKVRHPCSPRLRPDLEEATA